MRNYKKKVAEVSPLASEENKSFDENASIADFINLLVSQNTKLKDIVELNNKKIAEQEEKIRLLSEMSDVIVTKLSEIGDTIISESKRIKRDSKKSL